MAAVVVQPHLKSVANFSNRQLMHIGGAAIGPATLGYFEVRGVYPATNHLTVVPLDYPTNAAPGTVAQAGTRVIQCGPRGADRSAGAAWSVQGEQGAQGPQGERAEPGPPAEVGPWQPLVLKPGFQPGSSAKVRTVGKDHIEYYAFLQRIIPARTSALVARLPAELTPVDVHGFVVYAQGGAGPEPVLMTIQTGLIAVVAHTLAR